MNPLLSVQDLSVRFVRRGEPDVVAVDGVSFDVRPGEVVGLVGESGCGKSVTSLAIMGLLPGRTPRVSGSVLLDGSPPVDLLTLSDAGLRQRRGRDIGMVFQDPLSSLNPVVPVGVQITEALTRHRGMDRRAARDEAVALLDRVGIPDPVRRLRAYPHQMSGGMRQRALIAIALACRPRLLIADEPTTALDVTIQAQILDLINRLKSEKGTAVVLVTHDLGVMAQAAQRVAVMYAGRIVEQGFVEAIFERPLHPYTLGLLRSMPKMDGSRSRRDRLTVIPGSIPPLYDLPAGCSFQDRCGDVMAVCREHQPETTTPFPDQEVRCWKYA